MYTSSSPGTNAAEYVLFPYIMMGYYHKSVTVVSITQGDDKKAHKRTNKGYGDTEVCKWVARLALRLFQLKSRLYATSTYQSFTKPAKQKIKEIC